MKCLKIIVSGKVQGVGFRCFVRDKSLKYGLKGYVTNLYGLRGVEIVISGEKSSIDLLLKDVQHGPTFARVDNVKTEEIELSPFSDFRIQ